MMTLILNKMLMYTKMKLHKSSSTVHDLHPSVCKIKKKSINDAKPPGYTIYTTWKVKSKFSVSNHLNGFKVKYGSFSREFLLLRIRYSCNDVRDID